MEPAIVQQAFDEAPEPPPVAASLVVKLSMIPARIAAVKYRRRPDGPQGPERESLLELWFDPPHRGRIDRTWTRHGIDEHLATVVHDLEPPTGARRGETFDLVRRRCLSRPWGAAPTDDDVLRLFWPPLLRRIVAELTLDDPREVEVAGRAAVRVQAQERPGGLLWPQWLSSPADRYELDLDAEHGHLLGFRASWGASVLEGLEVTGVSYGDDAPEAVYTFGG